jgi:hypothetical protein
LPYIVEFVRILHNTKKGTALLVFKVPSPGLLLARAPKLSLSRPQGNERTAEENIRRLRLLQRRIKPRKEKTAPQVTESRHKKK